jgi:hypothetical protein
MIVTHTQNANGQRRVYIGGKGSLECWIEPHADRQGWSFHLDEAVTGNHLSAADKRAWAVHTLLALAEELAVAPADLAGVPFDSICALHANDPYAGRRVASSKRKLPEHGFISTAPGITRPRADFSRSANHQRTARTA